MGKKGMSRTDRAERKKEADRRKRVQSREDELDDLFETETETERQRQMGTSTSAKSGFNFGSGSGSSPSDPLHSSSGISPATDGTGTVVV